MRVMITGATGLIGSRLVERLHHEGHTILVLTRQPEKATQQFARHRFPRVEIMGYTPVEPGMWQETIPHWDGVVNLAGEAIAAGRWTEAIKQELRRSREVGTRTLVEGINQAIPCPSVLVNASAIGYYGTSETATFDETSPPGSDFLATLCQAWEAEATLVKTRLVILRFGIALDATGGALGKMVLPFQLFSGGPLGHGRQWVSWIHIDDLVNLILHALTDPSMEGTFNATAPNPVRMHTFCQTLGQVIHRPSWLPVPAFALNLLLGEGASVVLEGQQVLPKRTLASGFTYHYPTLPQALTQILK